MSDKPLISARGLSVGFKIGSGLFNKAILKAVDNVSLDIERGSFFGLVGESGSGKTTLGRAFLKAVPITGGHAAYMDDEVSYDLGTLTGPALKDFPRPLCRLVAAHDRARYYCRAVGGYGPDQNPRGNRCPRA
jgi:peptide/nickel transport system ATP-binding protein/oligopeptide transport system ATP-binding protein